MSHCGKAWCIRKSGCACTCAGCAATTSPVLKPPVKPAVVVTKPAMKPPAPTPKATPQTESLFDRPLPRTPDGTINNCAIANGEDVLTCQMCNGKCPDENADPFRWDPEKDDESIPDPLPPYQPPTEVVTAEKLPADASIHPAHRKLIDGLYDEIAILKTIEKHAIAMTARNKLLENQNEQMRKALKKNA